MENECLSKNAIPSIQDEIKNETEKKEKIKGNSKKEKGKIVIDDPVVKITFGRMLAYFIIYSFLGFVIETLFGMVTKGVIESRRSCLFGPYCCIYGLGAALMIPGLKPFKKSNWTLFLAGAVEGSIIEYVLSVIGELIFKIKWWDYSNMPFNINGRITLLFSVFWGLLAIGLIRFINPYVEKFINKIPEKNFKISVVILSVLIFADLLFTAFGLQVFFTRLAKNNNIEIKGEKAMTLSEEIMQSQVVQFLSKNCFTDEKILKTFPNIKFQNTQGDIIWIKDLLPEIQPYYFKMSNKFRLK